VNTRIGRKVTTHVITAALIRVVGSGRGGYAISVPDWINTRKPKRMRRNRMSKDELISKQQLQIEHYKQMVRDNKKTINRIRMRFIGCGAPLNDNVLQFNSKQMLWCHDVLELIDSIETDISYHFAPDPK
jgi:hypothetical protein